jgi:hypothetical protein
MNDRAHLNAWLEDKLIEWARWSLQNGEKMGWPETSPIFSLLMHGGVNSGTFGAKSPIVENPAAQEMDKCIAILWRLNKAQAEAIKMQYLERYQSLEELARRAKVNLSTFKGRLREGKNFLLGRLTAILA